MLIHSEATFTQGQVIKSATVKGRDKYPDGNIIRTLTGIWFLTRIELHDGLSKQYVANNIYENIYTQFNQHSHYYNLLDVIIDYSKDINIVSMEYKYIINQPVTRRLHQTTIG